MLMTLHVELRNMNKTCCMDEVVSEIDSTEDKMQILRPLTAKLKLSIIICNISQVTGNMPITIGLHKETKERKVFLLLH